MKKSLIFKILYLFLILIVVAGASVFATNTYLASQVTYAKSDGTELSVEQALNDLYSLKSANNSSQIYITEFSYTDSSYLKKYSNGIIEQGGSYTITGSTGNWTTFNFPVEFPNTCISAQLTGGCGSSGWTYANGTGINETTKSYIQYSNTVGAGSVRVQWYAIGY